MQYLSLLISFVFSNLCSGTFLFEVKLGEKKTFFEKICELG